MTTAKAETDPEPEAKKAKEKAEAKPEAKKAKEKAEAKPKAKKAKEKAKPKAKAKRTHKEQADKPKAKRAKAEAKPKKAKTKRSKKAIPARGKAKKEDLKIEKGKKEPTLQRGMTMNKWERWLCQYFEGLEAGTEVHNKELTEKIGAYIKEQEGPEDARRVILNSVRRLVIDGWIARAARGSYKTTDKIGKLAGGKEAIAKMVKAAREKMSWTRQQMADFLGHPSRGRYGTLEQGRRPMHIWEVYALARLLNLDIP